MSTLKVDTIQDTNAVEMYLCKAWVNFDGTWTSGDPIRGDGNVSSITDHGAGNYTVTFTNAMSDANYTAIVTADVDGVADFAVSCTGDNSGARTTTAVRVRVGNTGGTGSDSSVVSVAIFR